MKNEQRYFEELTVDFGNTTVFLDIDGTLVPDGGREFSGAVRAKVKELAAKNQVLLCTNKRDPARWRALEEIFSLSVLTPHHKKPSRKVLKGAGVIRRERIVIGDKFLTDALFARRIGARFIPVKRKLSGEEPIFILLVYFFDYVIGNLFKYLSKYRNR